MQGISPCVIARTSVTRTKQSHCLFVTLSPYIPVTLNGVKGLGGSLLRFARNDKGVGNARNIPMCHCEDECNEDEAIPLPICLFEGRTGDGAFLLSSLPSRERKDSEGEIATPRLSRVSQ